MKGLMIAGSAGKGKTIIALAVIAALKNLGYKVMPFKTGPDYADPSYHSLLAKTSAENLDFFTMGREGVEYIYSRKKDEFDFAVVEGEDDKSSRGIARILDLPVIQVTDRSGTKQVIAADASKERTLLGTVLEMPRIEIRRRQISGNVDKTRIKLGVKELLEIARFIDLGKIIELSSECKIKVKKPAKINTDKKPAIGVARDAAFCFHYPYNLEDLSSRARIIYFSPMIDALPDVSGLIFGGGYPELYAEQLSKNGPLLRCIRKAAEDGMPIFGECGGLMYLSRRIEVEGRRYKMAGVMPADIEMQQMLSGYVELEALRNCIVAEKSDTLRGHESHYSRAYPDGDLKYAFNVKRGEGIIDRKDGIMVQSALAQYTHIHTVGNPNFFEVFSRASAQYARR